MSSNNWLTDQLSVAAEYEARREREYQRMLPMFKHLAHGILALVPAAQQAEFQQFIISKHRGEYEVVADGLAKIYTNWQAHLAKLDEQMDIGL